MDVSKPTAPTFQQRRHATWLAVRAWLAAGILAVIGFLIPLLTNPAARDDREGGVQLSLEDMALWELNLCFGSFLVMMVAFVRVSQLVHRHYRCPYCNEAIADSEGVELNPERCPNCRKSFR